MGELRDITITLGSKTYALQTRLSPKEEESIKRLALEFFSSLAEIQDQEQKLVLGWLLMAHRLITAGAKIENLLSVLNELKTKE